MNFSTTNRLRKGDKIMVRAGSHGRAIDPNQAGGVEWAEVAAAYPAERDRRKRKAGTMVVFTDGHQQDFDTNAIWMVNG